MAEEPHEALYWEGMEGRIQCLLCPQGCRIQENRIGLCGIRMNKGRRLKAMAYGIYPAIHMDPIEKKPLNHFLPGTDVLSAGSVGCNLSCKMCQNWSLSRSSPDARARRTSPSEIAAMARSAGSPSVAFTYNEPTINYEFIMDAAPLLKKAGVRLVLVSNGYLNPGPWKELMGHTDAVNIDVKGFTERFYREIAGGHLTPVLKNVKTSHEQGVHVELTYLIIPAENDSEGEIRSFAEWVANDLSPDVPVHFSRFHPDYQMQHLPPTPVSTLEMARRVANGAGLRFVFIGNVNGRGYNDTICPFCGESLINRSGYHIDVKNLKDGRCAICGKAIHGVWS